MLQQPESPSPLLPASSAHFSAAQPTPPDPAAPVDLHNNIEPQQSVPHWLVRVELFLRVMLRIYIGLAICYAPWSNSFWDQNPLLLQFPLLGNLAITGAARGLVSGLGLLNLWIAFQDALGRRTDER
jgi:hypothetical protein